MVTCVILRRVGSGGGARRSKDARRVDISPIRRHADHNPIAIPIPLPQTYLFHPKGDPVGMPSGMVRYFMSM
eukprot:6703259-Pyramimonas_sp.AAC.1